MSEHCTQCRGTRKVLRHRPMIYETDSADEIQCAYDMASGPCPSCAKADRIRVAMNAVVQAARHVCNYEKSATGSLSLLYSAVRALEEAEEL